MLAWTRIRVTNAALEGMNNKVKAISIGLAIIVEASMSFLGVGVRPPTPTWGGMLKEGYPYVRTAPWLAVWSGMAIFITVLTFGLLGDAIQDRRPGTNPTGRSGA